MKRTTSIILCMAAVVFFVSQASALNIVLTNDDGFNTPNIKALYAALKAERHDVIMSAPSENQTKILLKKLFCEWESLAPPEASTAVFLDMTLFSISMSRQK